MRLVKLIILVLFIAFVIIFFMQNTTTISEPMSLHLDLEWASWTLIPLPFYVLLLAAFILGALIAGIFFFMEKIQHYSEIRSYRIKIHQLQQEIKSLREMPLRPTYPMLESKHDHSDAQTEDDVNKNEGASN